MSRILKSVLIAFFLGAGVGAFDALVLMIKEDGIRLLSPLNDALQMLLYYGVLTAVMAVGVALVRRNWKALSVGTTAGGLMFFAVTYIWVHSRILTDNSMFSAESLMATAGILVSCLVFVLVMRMAAKSKKAPIALLLFPILPSLFLLTKGVTLETKLADAPSADLPNVTVLLLDTQRADRLSCYGYERPDGKKTSPVIDNLANQGARFEWNYSAAPWTRPAVASMFTGLFPTSHGAFKPERALPGWCATMAELFHKSGYRTAGFSANPNISAVWGFAQGFQEFWCLDDKKLIDMVAWGEAERKIRNRLLLVPSTPDSAAVVNQEVFPWVDRMKGSDRPVFTYVQYLDPHFPYNPVEDIINDDPKPNYDELLTQVQAQEHTYKPFPFEARPQPSNEVLEGFKKLYDAEIAIMDRDLGVLVERLRSAELLGENDWLIITSDHGEEFFEHEQWGHGQNVYNEVLRVPLIIVGPGVPKGMVIETPVSLVDMLPTFAEILGKDEFLLEGVPEAKPNDDGTPGQQLVLPGKSLLPLWLDPSTQDINRAIYAEKLRRPQQYGLRIGDDKLIQVHNSELEVDYRTFYDTGKDPFETQGFVPLDMVDITVPASVADRFGPLPDGLEEAYGKLLLAMPLMTQVAGQLNQGVEEKALTPDEWQVLHDLGYL